MQNIGSTCYIGTLMTCLSRCKYITDKIDLCYKSSLFKDIILQLSTLQCSINPQKFIYDLSRSETMNQLDIQSQNDICEFYTLLIEYVNRIYPLLPINIRPNEFPANPTPYDIQNYKMKIEWSRWCRNRFSFYGILTDLLFGQTITQIRCAKCGCVHQNYEIFCNLMISLNSTDLVESLKHYFKKEVLGKDWVCSKCKNGGGSIKSFVIWKAPPIITITLKRFTWNGIKDEKSIDIPLTINMDQFCLSNTKKEIYVYDLVACACHSGSTSSGHYYSIIKMGETFTIVNDANITENYEFDNVKKDISGQGYMFFYSLRLIKD